MSFYQSPTRLTDPVGNNAIQYSERLKLGSMGKLFIPELIEGTISDIQLGHEICFEEIENGKLVSCTGLKQLVQFTWQNRLIYCSDNHQHALYFWYDALQKGLITKGYSLIHIDQHADMNEPIGRIEPQKEANLSSIAGYVNTKTQISSFIEPALHSGLIKECIQVRSEAKLSEITLDIGHSTLEYIVDLDLDFFAHETDYTQKISLIRELMQHASVMTVATSPYFLDQQKAIELVKMIFAP